MKKVFIFLLFPFTLAAQQADILIKNGKILDGTGNSWYYGDIAIQNGKIVGIGRSIKFTATKTIDANRYITNPFRRRVYQH